MCPKWKMDPPREFNFSKLPKFWAQSWTCFQWKIKKYLQISLKCNSWAISIRGLSDWHWLCANFELTRFWNVLIIQITYLCNAADIVGALFGDCQDFYNMASPKWLLFWIPVILHLQVCYKLPSLFCHCHCHIGITSSQTLREIAQTVKKNKIK